jgi:hypothetical protein
MKARILPGLHTFWGLPVDHIFRVNPRGRARFQGCLECPAMGVKLTDRDDAASSRFDPEPT